MFSMFVPIQLSLSLFKATNVDKICVTIPHVAAERCPNMEHIAQSTANKYRSLLLHFKVYSKAGI